MRRSLLHAADRWLLTRHVTEVVAQSFTVQRRLADALGVQADVLWPPPPPRAYRCDGYGDYVFAVSRLTPLKRVDLLVRALAEPAARGVRAVIAGEGESRLDARAPGGRARRRRARHVPRAARATSRSSLDHLARCRAVCFTPLDEDYGFVTVEAFASAKAGRHLPRQRRADRARARTARPVWSCDPTPASIAGALGHLRDDRAVRRASRRRRAPRPPHALSWSSAVERLVIV